MATAGFELSRLGFAVYLTTLADYGAVYASLGTVVAFVVFVFVSANVLLLGAEAASEWPDVRRGRHHRGEERPLSERLRSMVSALFVRRV